MTMTVLHLQNSHGHNILLQLGWKTELITFSLFSPGLIIFVFGIIFPYIAKTFFVIWVIISSVAFFEFVKHW